MLCKMSLSVSLFDIFLMISLGSWEEDHRGKVLSS